MDQVVDTTKMFIITKRLYLRAFRQSDLDDFYDYAKDPDVGPMAGWYPHKSKEETQVILNHFLEGKRTFAIVDKETHQVIGSIGLESVGYTKQLPEGPLKQYLETNKGRSLGYILKKEYWGRGLMKEAITAIMKDCFDAYGFDYFTVSHFEDNQQSRRVIEKAHFSYIAKGRVETKTGMHNIRIYLLKKEDAEKIVTN